MRVLAAALSAACLSQADTVARIRKDLARYREIVKAAGVKAE
jgi:tripartite-type tricarboxylate transporter receptor subunit TctC